MKGENGPYLKSLGLGAVSLNSEEVQIAQEVKNARPGLSVADCFALSCAARPNHCLVTGDGLLRKEATKRLGEGYGLLWLLDQIQATGQTARPVLAEGLTKISGSQPVLAGCLPTIAKN
jgi:hypothetical protein